MVRGELRRCAPCICGFHAPGAQTRKRIPIPTNRLASTCLAQISPIRLRHPSDLMESHRRGAVEDGNLALAGRHVGHDDGGFPAFHSE